jgi:pimeloyl-ACP methyl ester carboxylesterase
VRMSARTGGRHSRRARRCRGIVRWLPVLVLVPGSLAYASTGASAAAATVTAAPHWHDCSYAAGFQCASIQVPLDYAKPDGQKIDIAAIRHLAAAPSRPAGSLVVNPGGPGGPGSVVLPLIYNRFPAAVRDQYDIVSFDPRGVGRSDGLRCFASEDAENKTLGRWTDEFPVGSAQVSSFEQTQRGLDARCARQGGAILSHMSSADVARDMDVIRRDLGERRLNYYGISYGTVLGATYANLFRGHTGDMVLDGNVSPLAWADGDPKVPTGLRIGSDVGSARTLSGFLRLCGDATVSDCAFSAGSPAATTAKYATLLRRLRSRPVTVSSQTYTYAGTVSVVDDFLYTTRAEPTIGEMGWQAGARLLESIWKASGRPTWPATSPASASPASPSASSSAAASAADASQPYNGIEQELGVECADSPHSADPAAYGTQAQLATRRSGPFASMWAWRSEACASWPGDGDDRYTGPWNRPTASSILVVGNTSDPATPYTDAVSMSKVLARGRLLTVDQYGHTALLNGNTCAAGYVTRYLLTAALPRAGTACAQQGQPFSDAGD